jgi:hypothetical protein
MITIHTFGDSHAAKTHSHWGYINLPDVKIICNHIGGTLMYTFGCQGLNILNIRKYGVKENDIAIFCFGEIDCRNHVDKHVSEKTPYKDVIDELVINYFDSINKNKILYNNIKICVYNVVPPCRSFPEDSNHPYPFLGSDEERKLYHNYMNSKIKELCKINNFIYFDIYKQSCDENGFMEKEFSDGNVHLRHTEHSINFIKTNLL